MGEAMDKSGSLCEPLLSVHLTPRVRWTRCRRHIYQRERRAGLSLVVSMAFRVFPAAWLPRRRTAGDAVGLWDGGIEGGARKSGERQGSFRWLLDSRRRRCRRSAGLLAGFGGDDEHHADLGGTDGVGCLARGGDD